MKRRLAWIVGALALVGAYAVRRLRRPHAELALPSPVDAGPDPRAEELRRRLDESRPLAAEREAFEEGETPVDHVEAPEERRRAVHDEARAAAEQMRGGTPPS